MLSWLNENNGALMVVITAIYVFATILICYFNGKSASAAQKQIIETNIQQKQNANIQLYTLRRQVLNIFINEKYDEIFWDVSFLFNEEIFKEFQYLNKIKKQYISLGYKKQIYESELARKSLELKYEFKRLVSEAQYLQEEKSVENLYKFCDKYIFEQQKGNKIETYNYREIDVEQKKLHKEIPALHAKLGLKMQDFIKKSIL